MQHLHCFRQLPQQLAQASEAVQQLMASDLLSLLHFQTLPHLQDHILAAIMQHQEFLASGSVPCKAHMLRACALLHVPLAPTPLNLLAVSLLCLLGHYCGRCSCPVCHPMDVILSQLCLGLGTSLLYTTTLDAARGLGFRV